MLTKREILLSNYEIDLLILALCRASGGSMSQERLLNKLKDIKEELNDKSIPDRRRRVSV